MSIKDTDNNKNSSKVSSNRANSNRQYDSNREKRTSDNPKLDRQNPSRKSLTSSNDDTYNLNRKPKRKKPKQYYDFGEEKFTDKKADDYLKEQKKNNFSDSDYGLGTDKEHRQEKLNRLKDMVNDGKDIADAVSQKNTGKELNKLKNGLKGINPFNIKSLKKGVDDAVNQGAKMTLDKSAGGLGTILEKINNKLPIPLLKKTKDGKIDYTKGQPMLRIFLWLLALAIFLGFWLLLFLIIIAVVLGASYFAVSDDSSTDTTTEKSRTDSGDSNAKSIGSVDTPKELQGVVLMPVVDYVTSGWGMRDDGFHYGYDLQANKANKYNKVYANIEGTIVGTELTLPVFSRAKGNYVAVYNEKYKIIVSNQHLENFNDHPNLKSYIKVGNKVKIDTVIGYQGNTGSIAGYGELPKHVHIDTYINITPKIANGFNPYHYYNSSHAVDPSTLITCDGKSNIPSKVPVYKAVPNCKAYAMKMRKLN